jgi:hypothetical protein
MIGKILAKIVIISNAPANDPIAMAHSSQLGK